MSGIHASAADSALEALFYPFAADVLRPSLDGKVLFLRARDGFALRESARSGWLCEQTFKPFADALERSGLALGVPALGDRFAQVLVLPPRERDEMRALFARAVFHAAENAVVLAAVPNAEGAKSAEADLAKLLGPLEHLSKHKCRVFWAVVRAERVDNAWLQAWMELDLPRENGAGYVSRPGLFAWDRVDVASALLAEHIPDDLHGHIADLGAGYGYLSAQVIAHCPNVTAVDLYEAEARALEPARINLDAAVQARGKQVLTAVHWHDVSQGLFRKYDAIVSNPPFHQGRADMPELGRSFITRAADALHPHGRLWLVANRHLPYEATLSSRFEQVRTVTTASGFKVIEAIGVRP